MQNFISIALIFIGLIFHCNAQTLSKETIVIETKFGIIKIKLYEETPLHKSNFIKLVNQNYYDSLLFHRVINNFMIQGGDYLSKHATQNDSLGDGDIGYTIPAEIIPALFHTKGKLCAARDGDEVNPKFASSATQFYIVMGKVRTLEDLKKYEDRINKTRYTNCARNFIKSEIGSNLKQLYNRLKIENKTDSVALINLKIEEKINNEVVKTPIFKFTEKQIEAYTKIGGTPHLDGTYTVFGEVIEGLEIIDKIAQVKTGKRDRPLKDIRMKVSLTNK
jgi:peptidylprolyl isomerase